MPNESNPAKKAFLFFNILFLCGGIIMYCFKSASFLMVFALRLCIGGASTTDSPVPKLFLSQHLTMLWEGIDENNYARTAVFVKSSDITFIVSAFPVAFQKFSVPGVRELRYRSFNCWIRSIVQQHCDCGKKYACILGVQ